MASEALLGGRCSLLVLVHKLLVEGPELFQHDLEFLQRRKYRCPEMEGPWNLAKPATRNNTYSSVFKQLHYIEEVWSLPK